MERTSYKPPPGDSGTYIKRSKQNAAIPNKGIAAFFYSTVLWVFPFYLRFQRQPFTYIVKAHSAYVWLNYALPGFSVFIFPRCRSPPTNLNFSKNSDWRKGNV